MNEKELIEQIETYNKGDIVKNKMLAISLEQWEQIKNTLLSNRKIDLSEATLAKAEKR